MPEDEVAVEEEAPAKEEVLPGNCAGELVEQPELSSETSKRYKCAVCGQLVMVGYEQLAESGLPQQHAKLLEEGA